MATKPHISVIVATYNRPEALEAVLTGLSAQHLPQNVCFEVIVADDGSSSETKMALEQHAIHDRCDTHHIWHPDQGFRLAAIRNRAVLHAKGDYLIFLDGDCIPLPHFVHRHWQLAEPKRFVAGNRILLSAAATEQALAQKQTFHQISPAAWVKMRLTGRINRLLPLLFVPGQRWRRLFQKSWRAIGCNMGIWSKDLHAVNGFDERYQGWGYEDSDLVLRLQHAGVFRKDGRCATGVLHLWHKEADRSQSPQNWEQLQKIKASSITQAVKGLQEMHSSIESS